LLFGPGTGEELAQKPAACDFLADAFAHCKFIALSPDSLPLVKKLGLEDSLDDGVVKLGASKDVKDFIALLGELRHWKREDLFKG
jgi:catalase